MNENTGNTGIQISPGKAAIVAIGLYISMFAQSFIGTAFGTAMMAMFDDLQGIAWSIVGLLFTVNILFIVIANPVAPSIVSKIGFKKYFTIGAVLNLAAVVAMYFMKTFWGIVAMRALQGLISPALFAMGLTMIGMMFPEEKRAKWLSGYAIITAVGSIFGPLLAGLMVDNFTWRAIFLFDIPIAVIGIVMVLSCLPDIAASGQTQKFDVGGVITFGLAFSVISFLCLLGGTLFPWASVWTAICAVVIVACLIAFVQVEKKAESPMIPLAMFKNNVFTVLCIVMILNTIASMAFTTYLPSFMQGVLGTTATDSGVVMSILSIVSLPAAFFGGQLVSKTGKAKMLTFAVAIIGTMATLVFLFFDSATPIVVMAVAGGVWGLLPGIINFTPQTMVQNNLPPDKIGLGTAGVQQATVIGALLGIAITGIIMGALPDLTDSMPLMLKMATALLLVSALILLALKEEAAKKTVA